MTVGVEGDWLFIARITCGRCRRVLGESFVGDFTRMDDRARGVAQELAGLPKAPRLTTAEAWRAAFAQRPPPLLAGAGGDGGVR